MTAKNLSSSELGRGSFLRLERLQYQGADGAVHGWEAAQRTTSSVAAVLLATFVPSGKILLVKQYRPPVGAYVLEMCAGLVDPGESVEEAAVRELKEETGYVGKVLGAIPPVASSAGLTGEKLAIVRVEVDETLPENQHPVQNLQDNEDIEVILVAPSCLGELFRREVAQGSILDGRLAAWALGLGVAW